MFHNCFIERQKIHFGAPLYESILFSLLLSINLPPCSHPHSAVSDEYEYEGMEEEEEDEEEEEEDFAQGGGEEGEGGEYEEREEEEEEFADEGDTGE